MSLRLTIKKSPEMCHLCLSEIGLTDRKQLSNCCTSSLLDEGITGIHSSGQSDRVDKNDERLLAIQCRLPPQAPSKHLRVKEKVLQTLRQDLSNRRFATSHHTCRPDITHETLIPDRTRSDLNGVVVLRRKAEEDAWSSEGHKR